MMSLFWLIIARHVSTLLSPKLVFFSSFSSDLLARILMSKVVFLVRCAKVLVKINEERWVVKISKKYKKHVNMWYYQMSLLSRIVLWAISEAAFLWSQQWWPTLIFCILSQCAVNNWSNFIYITPVYFKHFNHIIRVQIYISLFLLFLFKLHYDACTRNSFCKQMV